MDVFLQKCLNFSTFLFHFIFLVLQNTQYLDFSQDITEEKPKYKFQNFNALDWKTSKLNTYTLPDSTELSTDGYFR